MTFDLQPFAEAYSEAFLGAARFTLAAEGGGKISDHPADKGGRTRWGIAEKFHPDAWRDGPPSLATALGLYHHKYWLPIKGDDLPLGIDLAVFDSAVLWGVRKAAQWLQLGLNAAWGDHSTVALSTPLAVDGIIGSKTLRRANLLHWSAVINSTSNYIIWRRMLAHARRVRKRPDQAVFLVGWATRCADLSAHILTQKEVR